MPNPFGFTPTKELQESPLHKEHEATRYAQWKVRRQQTAPSSSQYKSSVDNGMRPQSMNCSVDVSHITSPMEASRPGPAHKHADLTYKWDATDWVSCLYIERHTFSFLSLLDHCWHFGITHHLDNQMLNHTSSRRWFIQASIQHKDFFFFTLNTDDLWQNCGVNVEIFTKCAERSQRGDSC